MKNSLFTLAFALVSSLVLAQTNYVKSTSYKEPVQNQTQINALVDDQKIETITYLDGLGRPIQSIVKQAGGNKEDIITPIVYDNLGRQVKDFLPYFRTNSSLNYEIQNTAFFNNLDIQYQTKYPTDIDPSAPNPFSEKSLEDSPLNRILEQGAPGKDWQVNEDTDSDHTIKFDYQTNIADEVDRFSVIFPNVNTEEPQLYYEGAYSANELYKTITKDENWEPNQSYPKAHTTEEFTNSLGQVVLKRTFIKTTSFDTYYTYDDFGNLTYVLSPKGIDSILYANKYPTNYTNTIPSSEFVPTDSKGVPVTGSTGNVLVALDVSTPKLVVSFNISFNTATALKNGPIAQLSSYVPNMILGNITSAGVNYVISVQDGFLYIAGSGDLTSVNDSFAVTLPDQSVNINTLDLLCYQYHYDKRNRLVEKKIPQKGWEYIIYDKLDRPVLTQDALLQENDDWLFTKYDEFDRPAYTGKYNSSLDRIALQNVFNSQSLISVNQSSSATSIDNLLVYYSNNVYPTSSLTLHTVNYYDDYNASLANVFPNPGPIFSQILAQNTKSLPTGSLIRVLDTNDWITAVTYYDDKAQPIYIGSENEFLDTTDTVKTELDFTGTVTKTESLHSKVGHSPITITDRFTYDHANRLITQKQEIAGEPEELIVKNEYDELGQLWAKGVGSIEASPLQTVDYTYNIRGWLKQINDPTAIGNDLFSFKINYNTAELGLNNDKLFNGNISETIWKTANDINNTTTRGYAYEYDALNRIKSGNMAIDTGSGYLQASGYHTNGLKYDKNGNIMSLKRTGQTAVFDDLIYDYSGNQLNKVTDGITNQQTEGFIDGNTSGDDYAYDDNGNMIEDKNKGIIGIDYNHLNLPVLVDFGSGDKIEYIYDATGVKQYKKVTDNGTSNSTLYASNFVYEASNSGEELKFFSHPEGYIEPDNSGNFNYIYQYKDHLGNIRLSFSDTNDNYESLVSNSFYEEYDGWHFGGGAANGSIEIENDRLKVNVKNQWNGTYIELSDNFTVGDIVELHMDIDKGDTQDVRIFLSERDVNNNHLAWYVLNYDAQTGSYTYNHTMVSGSRLRLKIDKSNTNLGVETHFYVDNVYATSGELEIVEENNYYPFGLKHKGYNNVVTSTNTAENWKFQGQELTEDLGLNVYEWRYRTHDPAIGRFWQIDPLTDKYEWMTPYQFSSNQPIHASELEGLETSMELNSRDPNLKNASPEELAAFKQGMVEAGGVFGAVFVDVLVTKGKLTEHLLKQTAINTSFNAADQVISGEGLDLQQAATDAVGNADLFDAGFDVMTSKLPGGPLVNQVMEHLAPSMVDMTLDGGVEVGGVNKDLSDVATDFTFSVVTDKIKGTDIPNMKFSGNSMVKSIKNNIIDYGSDRTRNSSMPAQSSKPLTTNRRHTDPRLNNQRVQDNTRVRKPVIRAHGN